MFSPMNLLMPDYGAGFISLNELIHNKAVSLFSRLAWRLAYINFRLVPIHASLN